MPGEHDASLDNGEAFQEFFGKTHYTFDHKGVHFIAVDNVSDPRALHRRRAAAVARGRPQAAAAGREHRRAHAPAAVRSVSRSGTGPRATARRRSICCMPHPNVTVFYGHIHQEHHQMTGHIAHHAAKGLMFPLPVAGIAAEARPVAVGSGAALPGARLPRHRGGSQGRVQAHRVSGGKGLMPCGRQEAICDRAWSRRARRVGGWPACGSAAERAGDQDPGPAIHLQPEQDHTEDKASPSSSSFAAPTS